MKENNTTNSHDNFFKIAFSTREVVEDYITQFLPQKLVNNLDIKQLTLDNTTYATAELSEYFADVVWHCSYGVHKKPIKTVFLFEHKSFVPKYPHIQILRYMLEIWEIAIKNKEELPLVIPIIVYHNQKNKKWLKKPFFSYFKDIDKELHSFIPNFDYQLTDLTTLDDDTITNLNMGLLINTFLTLRHGSDEAYILSNLETLFVKVKKQSKDSSLLNFLYAQLVYIIKNTELSRTKAKFIIEELSKSTNMSTYDVLFQDAIEQGVEKGIEIQNYKKNVDFVNSLIASTDFDDEKIAFLVGVDINFVEEQRKLSKSS